MEVLGIDIGGSGIKGAPVETKTGKLITERYRIPTPQPATPKTVVKTVTEMVKHFEWSGPIGCGFPAVIQNGTPCTASNIHRSWIGNNAEQLIAKATGCPTRLVNDADAAGLAEIAFGAGKNQSGVIILITVGTGLGTALFTDGILLPNSELGHIQFNGGIAERYAADSVRKREDLSWKKWAGRFNGYLIEIEKLLWPNLFIVGGGVSKKFLKFSKYLTVQSRVIPAELKNEAGIIGAALCARAI